MRVKFKTLIGSNYSFLINLIVVALIVFLIFSSTRTEKEAIDLYVANDTEFPALVNYGGLEAMQINSEFQLLNSELPLASHEFIISVENLKLFTNDSWVDMTLYFANIDAWNQISDSNFSLLYFDNTANLLPDNLTEFQTDFMWKTFKINPEEMQEIFVVPKIITGFFDPYQPDPNSEDHISLILPFTEYINTSFRGNPSVSLQEFFYFNPKFISSSNKFSEIEVQVSTLQKLVKSFWLARGVPEDQLDYSLKSLLLLELYWLERSSYEDLSSILSFLLPKILFIEIIILYGYFILLQQKFKEVDLLFSRGYSLDKIRKNMILRQLFSLVLLIIILRLITLIPTSSNFQIQYIYQIIVPWLLLYFSASVWLILKSIKQFKIEIQYPSQLASTKSFARNFKIYKMLIYLTLITILITLFHLLFSRNNGINYKFIIGLSRTIVLIILIFIMLFLEHPKVEAIAKKNPIRKIWYSQIKQKKFFILTILLIISSNLVVGTYLNSFYYYDLQNVEYRKSMGDYSLEFVNENEWSKVNNSQYNYIKGVQSYLIVYHSFIFFKNFDVDIYDGTLNSFKLFFVNQSDYNNFECRNCDEFNNAQFFGNKVWVPKFYYNLFNSQKEPFKASMGWDRSIQEYEFSFNMNSDMFSPLPQSSGIAVSGNTLITSIETWTQFGFPLIENIVTSVQVLLTFTDQENIDDNLVAKRISNAINVPQTLLRVKRIDVESDSKYEKQIRINNYTDLLFTIFASLILMNAVLGNKAIRTNLITLKEKYGLNKIISKLLLGYGGIFLIYTLLGFISGLIIRYSGNSYDVLTFVPEVIYWKPAINHILLLLISQIGSQLIYIILYFRKMKQNPT